MSKFHLGILVGFFLGALATLVVLGIVYLYIEEQREKRAAARTRQLREQGLATSRMLPGANDYLPPKQHLTASLKERPGEIIYYLYILIE